MEFMKARNLFSIFGILLFGLLLFSSNSRADTWIWKFKIPMGIYNIPTELKSIRIDVFLYDKNNEAVGYKYIEKALKPGGRYDEEIIVKFYSKDINKNRYPGEATQYMLGFYLSPSPPNGLGPYYLPNQKGKPLVKSKTGTVLVPQVVGSLPIPKTIKIIDFDLQKNEP